MDHTFTLTVPTDRNTLIAIWFVVTYLAGIVLARWSADGDASAIKGDDAAFMVFVFLLSPIVVPLIAAGFVIWVLGRSLLWLLLLGVPRKNNETCTQT